MAEPKYRAQLAGVGPTLLLVDLNADTLEQAQYEAAEVALDCGAASGTTGARSDSPRRLAPTPDRGETADDQEAIRAPSRPVRGDRG